MIQINGLLPQTSFALERVLRAVFCEPLMGRLVKSPRLPSLQDHLRTRTTAGKALDCDCNPEAMENDGDLHDAATGLAGRSLANFRVPRRPLP